ncbi:MAG: NAD(P)/FAD-dependent oxidoreductase, partial [Burkholderiaceae bacterium]
MIIGAGPVGLFQVFELGLQEIRCCVLDSLAEPGGQCIELYPDKPIYDIPAIPVCTGRELTESLLAQCKPFDPFFDLGSRVETLARQSDGRWLVGNAAGRRYLARTVFIAAGAGAFQPQELPVPDVARFLDSQLFYRVRDREALRGKRIIVCGGGDSALDWAIDLVGIAASVTLIHRRDKFRAAPASVARLRALQAEGRLRVAIGHAQGFTEEAGR